MPKSLKENFSYFMENRDKIVSGHIGESVLIYDEAIIGYFPSDVSAYQEAIKQFAPGSFLIQKCLAEKESYTQTFHSRVTFA
jgi:hypothetical protein